MPIYFVEYHLAYTPVERLLFDCDSWIPSSPCSIIHFGKISDKTLPSVVEKMLEAYVFTSTKSGFGESIFLIPSSRIGNDVSNSHFSHFAPCPKMGGSMIIPSYVFPRLPSRSTNLITSSSIHRILFSWSHESCIFFCAQPIVGFEASTWVTCAPSFAQAIEAIPV